MGTGSSVDNRVAGKSKTFHVTVKDAKDVRPQSVLSYCAEVHVRDEASQCIDVMFICDEWGSTKGGGSPQNADHADCRLQTADRADHADCADRAD